MTNADPKAPTPTGVEDLDLSNEERLLLSCVESSRGRPRLCARHAIRHLMLAWRIRAIDPEMAVFRAITAEEEAATALFLVLQEHGYRGVGRKHYRNHEYKQGLWFFMSGVAELYEELTSKPELRTRHWELGDKHRLSLELRFPNSEWIEVRPPLGFSLSTQWQDPESGELRTQPTDFAVQLNRLAEKAKRETIREHINAEANARNRLLYADETGMPELAGPAQPIILNRKHRVFWILQVYCLVAPYRKHALFVQQSLDAFNLAMDGFEPRSRKHDALDANDGPRLD